MAAKIILCLLALVVRLVDSSGVNYIAMNPSGLDGSSFEVFGEVDTATLATAPQMIAISGCKFIIAHAQGSGTAYTLYRTRTSCDLKVDDPKKSLDAATDPSFALGVTTDGAVYGFLYINNGELYFHAYSFRDDASEGSAVQISPSSDATLTYQNPTLVGINTTHFIAAWNTYDGSNPQHVFFTIVSKAGVVSYTSPVQISESIYGYYMSNPVVSIISNGSYIFFWQSASTTNWQLRAKAYTSLFVQEKNSYVLNSVTGTVTTPLICGAIGISDATFVVSYTYTISGEQNNYFTIAYVSAVEEVSAVTSAVEENTYGLPFEYYNMFGMIWTTVYTNHTKGVLSNIYAKTGSLNSDLRNLAWNAGLDAVVQGTDNNIYALLSEYHDYHASRTKVYMAQVYNQTLSGSIVKNSIPVMIGLAIMGVLIA